MIGAPGMSAAGDRVQVARRRPGGTRRSQGLPPSVSPGREPGRRVRRRPSVRSRAAARDPLRQTWGWRTRSRRRRRPRLRRLACDQVSRCRRCARRKSDKSSPEIPRAHVPTGVDLIVNPDGVVPGRPDRATACSRSPPQTRTPHSPVDRTLREPRARPESGDPKHVTAICHPDAAFRFALLGSSMLRWQPTRFRPQRTP